MKLPKKILLFAAAASFVGLLVSIPQAQDGAIPKPDATVEIQDFRLIGGDRERGSEAFTRLNCIQCHTVAGVEVPAPKGERRLDLKIAEEVRYVKGYEDLIVAITNPRHVVTERYRAILSDAEFQGAIEPFMSDLTDHMSVRQLLDLVTFLNEVYTKAQPSYGKAAAE